ncbi:MAG: hypothetical protein AUH07_09595 [Gemmatimonadetes bacterium 13_2_20CM_70_9]|nr:MAG: hypothetical protein AUH07_09595 [Gemmatimonadetes bacterium 13_2_20CM_70_9]
MPVCRYRYRIVAGLATAALAVVAACHTDTGTAPQNPALTAAQAQSLGEAMTADAQSELEAITLSGGGSFAPGMAAAALGADPASCSPTISPLPVTNADGDRVPDSIRVSFPGCAFVEGDEADTIRGTIDVVDPTPTVTDHDLRIRFTDFTRIEVENGRERSIVLNGTREALRDATVISQSEINFQTVYTFGDGHTASSDRNWNATFTADVPGSIQPDQPLPSGTLSIAGTATWTRDANTFSVTASTDPVLHYNASCTVRPKFDSGTLHLTVTRNGATSTVTIQFTACGQYTVTRS